MIYFIKNKLIDTKGKCLNDCFCESSQSSYWSQKLSSYLAKRGRKNAIEKACFKNSNSSDSYISKATGLRIENKSCWRKESLTYLWRHLTSEGIVARHPVKDALSPKTQFFFEENATLFPKGKVALITQPKSILFVLYKTVLSSPSTARKASFKITQELHQFLQNQCSHPNEATQVLCWLTPKGPLTFGEAEELASCNENTFHFAGKLANSAHRQEVFRGFSPVICIEWPCRLSDLLRRRRKPMT